MAQESQSDESITDHDVSTASLTKHEEEEYEPKSGVVNLLLTNVLDDTRKMIPGG